MISFLLFLLHFFRVFLAFRLCPHFININVSLISLLFFIFYIFPSFTFSFCFIRSFFLLIPLLDQYFCSSYVLSFPSFAFVLHVFSSSPYVCLYNLPFVLSPCVCVPSIYRHLSRSINIISSSRQVFPFPPFPS